MQYQASYYYGELELKSIGEHWESEESQEPPSYPTQGKGDGVFTDQFNLFLMSGND